MSKRAQNGSIDKVYSNPLLDCCPSHIDSLYHVSSVLSFMECAFEGSEGDVLTDDQIMGYRLIMNVAKKTIDQTIEMLQEGGRS